MIKKVSFRLIFVLLVALILFSVVSAISASNSVPNVRLTDQTRSVSINDLAPPECAGLNLTNLITYSGDTTIVGTNENDLILGSPNAEQIWGGAGNDCLVGGGGNDSIAGVGGTDVCIGGPGNDTFYIIFIIFPIGGCETTYD
jgi:Ca2+-binding RTX toxin-like protein